MALYTVFGGRGFIGSEIVNQLTDSGHTVYVPKRGDGRVFKEDLGCVIYCAGHGNCNAPFDVFEANVSLLKRLLQEAKFDYLLYMSSTRVYMNQKSSNEIASLTICGDDERRLFNLTKLLGEELCLKSKRKVCIVRPSNVYGVALNSPLFLPSITRNAITFGKVDMYIPCEYSKDYVSVQDVASCCINLATNQNVHGEIVNIAAGYNVSAKEIADTLIKHTGCEVNWHEVKNFNERFPTTDISKLKKYISTFSPRDVLSDLQYTIENFKKEL
ncbi:dTDP-glucose 4,6-dehydratase [Pseudoalteromonas sp. PS1M3]|uniref:NAD-dependent epimerase/dehydratase family protein n=1 Tax=Pseudoalteromonas sp. PS1M3 TaxID=87791 RepID=UPI00194DEE25|nr:SDR family oxidoreductase [Pseudoalteromonas sp. PS1M3]BBW90328.1 dTDP-glucose 4,6-dehydratase [Pseudoalteromonas sp. PS1M3]